MENKRVDTDKTLIWFIINPVSGKRSAAWVKDLLPDIFPDRDFIRRLWITGYAGEAAEIAQKALQEKAGMVVAVGGDGTLNEIASVLRFSDIPLGIVPLGSGNGLARHLGIPLDALKALELIKKGKTLEMDTAVVNDRPFVSIAGVGFDAKVAHDFNKTARRGFLSYARHVFRIYPRYKPRKYRLLVDQKISIKTRALFISFANSNQFGNNTIIAPQASLMDGKLDVCIVSKPRFVDLPLVLSLLLRRKIDQSRYVQWIQCKEVKLKRNKGRWINLDGESLRADKNLEIKIVPASLKVIC